MSGFLSSDQPVIAIIGPSGTGKSTIIEHLINKGLLDLTPTWTDRPRRPGEEVLEHRFVSKEEFDKLVADHFFLHPPVSFFNLPYRYGLPKLPKPSPGRAPAVMARIMALQLLNSLYPKRIIYQIEAPYEQVATRLGKRTQTGVELGSRLDDYKKETEEGRRHANRIFVNDGSINKTVKQLAAAIRQDFNIAEPK